MADQFLFRVWGVGRGEPDAGQFANSGELCLDRALLGKMDGTLSRTENAPRLISPGGTTLRLELPEGSAQPVLVLNGLQFESLQQELPPSQELWRIAPQELALPGRLAMGQDVSVGLVRQLAWNGPGPTHHLYVLGAVDWVRPGESYEFDTPATLVIGRAGVDLMSLSTIKASLGVQDSGCSRWCSFPLGPLEAAMDGGFGLESLPEPSIEGSYVLPEHEGPIPSSELKNAADRLLRHLGRSTCFIPLLDSSSRPALGFAFRRKDGSAHLIVGQRDPGRWLSELEALLGRKEEESPSGNVVSSASSPVPAARFGAVETRNRQLAKVFDELSRVTSSDLTVLFLGESGTGKEHLARSLHKVSSRADRPFVAVNCSAIPEHLIPSELFGYKKGAFTGADTDRGGAFVAADSGTLFLDEIGDAPLAVQVALLRALESHQIRPVGSDTERTVNVRVLAATSRDLRALIRQGRFREDLYFRLAELTVELPPLRHRREDIPNLVRDLLAPVKPPVNISDQAMSLLAAQLWPGNVRELNNALKRVVARSQGASVLRISHFLGAIDIDQPGPLPGGRLQFPTEVTAAGDHLWKEGKLRSGDGPRHAERALHRAALLYLSTRTPLPEWPQPLWHQWNRLFGPKWASSEQGRNLRDLIRVLDLDPRDEWVAYEIESRVAATS